MSSRLGASFVPDAVILRRRRELPPPADLDSPPATSQGRSIRTPRICNHGSDHRTAVCEDGTVEPTRWPRREPSRTQARAEGGAERDAPG
ncbi:hypothetical protein [Nannocystis exedens]|uniref:hypothetical protein n=1 Tax=Nannocystis exedens TaxID=54 RepID=UPI0014765A3B|nr:hypothetical protein [Nannocystis exedens]